ncbi:MAG: hypothetical protein AMXMBFR84_18000 [Candidatus Hydrogenedentota bacterium]
MIRSKVVEKVVERTGDLPAMPELVAEVLRLTDDPLTDMSEVSEVLERDPALTAKILRISNSPYYGMKQYVGTLKLALVILGVREVRNIVLGVSVFDALKDDRVGGFGVKEYLNHSFLVGGLSKALAIRLRSGVQGEAFVAGLLHDMGKLIMIKQLRDDYVKILKATGGSGAILCVSEIAKFGFSHSHAAAALAIRWNFPETLADSLLYHHPAEGMSLSQAKDPQLAAVVRIANLCAHDEFSGEDGAPFLAGEDTEAWEILDATPDPLPPATRYTALAGLRQELKDSSPPSF